MYLHLEHPFLYFRFKSSGIFRRSCWRLASRPSGAAAAGRFSPRRHVAGLFATSEAAELFAMAFAPLRPLGVAFSVGFFSSGNLVFKAASCCATVNGCFSTVSTWEAA